MQLTHKLSLTLSLSVFALASPAFAEGWNGYVEGGLTYSDRSNTDTDIEEPNFHGGWIGGYAQTQMGDLRFAIDGRYEVIGDNGIDDTYETGPVHAGGFALHLGREAGPTYLGVLAGISLFDGYDQDGAVSGEFLGIEAEHQLNARTSVFGQIGYASLIGYEGDNEFEGTFGRIGIFRQFGEKLNATFSLDHGYSSDCFVDCGDQPGEYFGVSVEGQYALRDNLMLTGELCHLRVEDYDDPDTGKDLSVFVGLRLNFGGGSQSNLKMPVALSQAGGWMEPLD